MVLPDKIRMLGSPEHRRWILRTVQDHNPDGSPANPVPPMVVGTLNDICVDGFELSQRWDIGPELRSFLQRWIAELAEAVHRDAKAYHDGDVQSIQVKIPCKAIAHAARLLAEYREGGALQYERNALGQSERLLAWFERFASHASCPGTAIHDIAWGI
jgi:hypothetical protein